MNKLINVQMNENQEPIVSGRELHEFLQVKTPYTQWFERKLEFGFVENVDFKLVSQKCETNNPKNPFTKVVNHELNIDMAKEISMLERNDRGKQAWKGVETRILRNILLRFQEIYWNK